MYPEIALDFAAEIISKAAKAHNVPEAQVRADIEASMNDAMNNPNPNVQEKWKSFQYSGTKPTVEEFILWLSYLTLS